MALTVEAVDQKNERYSVEHDDCIMEIIFSDSDNDEALRICLNKSECMALAKLIMRKCSYRTIKKQGGR